MTAPAETDRPEKTRGKSSSVVTGVIAFVVTGAVWLAYFYFIDMALMVMQGLPVGWDLMPA